LIVLVALNTALFAQDHTAAAETFLSLLDEPQKKKAQYSYDDNERFNWNFVPTSRKGISFHDFNPKQRDAAMTLLKASLSDQGFKKASGIFSLEAILREVEGRDVNDTYRDPLNYFFTIFGEPSKDKVWGWRMEGHHLALNFSSAKGVVEASTPTFFGSNPAIVPSGSEKGRKTLKEEIDLGFALVNSLNADQIKKAKFSDQALPEIVSGNKRQAELLDPRGINFKEFTDSQKKIFLDLLNVYVKNYQLGFSDKLMTKIKKAGIENLSFGWAGAIQPGQGHYYRIQGPMLLIEYDNTQTNANHVHTTVRDLTNDFAEDILKEHYEKEHKGN
jgi:Protein of unknown function (DUF3500)